MTLAADYMILHLGLLLAIVAFSLASPRSQPEDGSSKVAVNGSKQPIFSFDELYTFQKWFLDNFTYPADAVQARSIRSTLLAENVQGRIDITRTFEGRELNTEYLFGLFANLVSTPGSVSLLGVPVSYKILHFAASGNVVSALTQLMFNFTALDIVVPIQIDSWNTYDDQKQISQYDATFRYWQWTVDFLFQRAAAKFHTNSTQATVSVLQSLLAKSICGTAQRYCNGTNQQYGSVNECEAFLTKGVRFGSAYELGRNTLLCRMVHQNMVPYRPDVHCSHVGKTGGGYCGDDKDYVKTVTEDFFHNAPYIPFGHG